MASSVLKRKRKKPDEATRLARVILPGEQAKAGEFRAVDVANRSTSDQRDMVSLKRTRTIRRRTHIEKLKVRLGMDEREAAACQWYADAHALRYDTLGVTAKYGESGRSNTLNHDHLPRNRRQEEAWRNFDHARSCISAPLRPMFERIVIQRWAISPQLKWLFRLAARQLMHGIEDRVDLGGEQ